MSLHLTFRSLAESAPGSVWREVFQRGWPGWRDWYLAHGGDGGAAIDRSLAAMRRYMPAMERVWSRLVEVAKVDGDAAHFLTFWSPPRYLVNCSQAVLNDTSGPILIRNYDLDPKLNERTLLRTRWLDRTVIGMTEGMAGLADGMNDAGLAVSLTFGGRVEVGQGFGIPLIVRYLLEVCSDVADAVEVLRHVPCHMSYNVTLLDRSANWATVMLAPDRPPFVTASRFATNHQIGIEWPKHGRDSRTLERSDRLDCVLKASGLTQPALEQAFLSPPLFATGYDHGFGTVYTAVYRPVAGAMSLIWRDGGRHDCSFGDFPIRRFHVEYGGFGSRLAAASDSRMTADVAPCSTGEPLMTCGSG